MGKRTTIAAMVIVVSVQVWVGRASCPSADVTGDCFVDFHDLADVTAQWLTGDHREARTATYIVASSDAPAHVKAEADFICDGTADEQEIQAAVDSLSAEGGEIYLHGVFVLDDAVVVEDKPIVFRGCGVNWYWDKYPGDNYVGTMIVPSEDNTGEGASSLLIYRSSIPHTKGMYFGGLYEIGFCGRPSLQGFVGTDSVAVDISSEGDFAIYHCGFFYLPYEYPVKLNCHGAWIENCDIEDCASATGALYLGRHRNWVVNCYFRGNKQDIYAIASEHFIVNCRFSDTGRNQLYLQTPVEVIISNCFFNTWNQDASDYAAIEFQSGGARRVLITNSYFTFGDTGTAPAIWDNGKAISHVTIANNIFYNKAPNQQAIAVSAAVAPCKIAHNIGDDEIVTGTVALQRFGTSYLDSSSGVVTATLPDGLMPGDIKIIRMSDAANSSTVSVRRDAAGNPKVGTFSTTDDYWILMWSGNEWVTVAASCAF